MGEIENDDFYLLAVCCTRDGSTGQRKLEAMKPYCFRNGIAKVYDDLSLQISDKSIFKRDTFYSQYMQDKNIAVNISAIVGENGSGKSTVVEYVIRLINNFSAMVLGEGFNTSGDERLHYIFGVCGALFYMLKGTIYSLVVEDDFISINKYIEDPLRNGLYIVDKAYNATINNKKIVQGNALPKLYYGEKTVIPVLNAMAFFFYSIVSNYSIYAYNTNDYKDESTKIEVEKTIRKGRSGSLTEEKCSWLHGLFHKNDGYQTPIVLMPQRKKGIIDINTENVLVKERLLTTIVRNKNYRVINGHLNITKVECSVKSYGAACLRKNLSMRCRDLKGYPTLKERILKAWSRELGKDLGDYKNKTFYNVATDYIVYKTIKISANYSRYNSFYNNYKTAVTRFDEEPINKLVQGLVRNRSHITQKLRQALAYLVYNVYDEYHNNIFSIERIDSIDKAINDTKKARENLVGYLSNYDDLMIPPFFRVDIKLDDNGKDVRFQTLSSGEKQQAYSVSSLLYQLKNLDSVWNDKDSFRLKYENVLIILEEIELYYHPELQKQLIKNLLDGIKQADIPHIKAINIIIVTHSPFVLSDIASCNIMRLSNIGKEDDELKTFGANIHDIMDTGFFFKVGAMGDYAEWLLNKLIIVMQQYRKPLCYEDVEEKKKELDDKYVFLTDFYTGEEKNFNKKDFCKRYPLEWLKRTLDYFDEPILKGALEREYERIAYKDGNTAIKKERIMQKIKRLTTELEELEGE